jgi:hypothetical protein
VNAWLVDVRGGGSTDSMNATWPFARLRADRSCIDYRLIFEHYTLKRDDVVEVSRYRYLMIRGLRIVHRRTDLPKLLLFYATRYDSLMQQLEELGYTVKETCSVV